MKVLTFGTFDHLHPGHIAYLHEAEQRGELYVVVARDSSVVHIKGHAPDQPEDVRVRTIQEQFPEAAVSLGDENDYLAPVRSIQPDLILMGYDQKLPPGIQQTDLPCPIEVASPYKPDQHKSSLYRK